MGEGRKTAAVALDPHRHSIQPDLIVSQNRVPGNGVGKQWGQAMIPSDRYGLSIRIELLPASRTLGLSRCGDPLEFHRADIAVGRVAAGWVVEAFDIIEHVGPGIVSCPVDLAGDPLGFER